MKQQIRNISLFTLVFIFFSLNTVTAQVQADEGIVHDNNSILIPLQIRAKDAAKPKEEEFTVFHNDSGKDLKVRLALTFTSVFGEVILKINGDQLGDVPRNPSGFRPLIWQGVIKPDNSIILEPNSGEKLDGIIKGQLLLQFLD